MPTWRFLADTEFALRDGQHTVAWDIATGPRDPTERQIWKDAGSPAPAPYVAAHLTRRPLPAAAMKRVANVPTTLTPSKTLTELMEELQRIEDALLVADDVAALRAQMVAIVNVLRDILVPRL